MDSLAARAPEGQEFRLASGRVLKNLYELSNALRGMDDDTFSHHVNYEKNDFANWIRHAFSDEQLADVILGSKDKEQIMHHLSQRLVHPNVGELPHVPNAEKEQSYRGKRKKLSKIFSRKESDDSGEEEPEQKEDERAAVLIKESKANVQMQQEMLKRLDEVLAREREIDFREQKIQEIEENIENQLKDIKDQKQDGAAFFSKEFVQGLVAGFLITLICTLLYIKFIF